VSKRVQLSGVSWKSACEDKTRSLVTNGRLPGAQLIHLAVDKSPALVVVTRGSECRKVKNLPW
jgi:hypothetical protein